MSDTLVASISGVRGIVGKDLTPEFVAKYAASFGVLSKEAGYNKVVLARDSRTSGPMFASAVRAGLQSVGVSVIECGMIPTPTAQLAVEHFQAGGGIILTASHNPVEWNALKFVGPDGLFLGRESIEKLFALVSTAEIARCDWSEIGGLENDDGAIDRHIEAVFGLDYVDADAIRDKGFVVALDCAHGAGGTTMPLLLERLGCTVVGRELEPTGRFTRPPEPVPANLVNLGNLVKESKADLGMAVDPDVDRLALVDHRGLPIGEDYTLAFAVGSILERIQGPVVTNLSTSLVVDDVARDYEVEVLRAPVGEANVAHAMKEAKAVIGGEGNGGVMLPDLHLGRDAPLGAALVLDMLVRKNCSIAEMVAAKPSYSIVKAKADRVGEIDSVYAALEQQFSDAELDKQDGLRMAWNDSWLHVRPSGTEPIVRLIAEAPELKAAEKLVADAREVLEAVASKS
ncbi:MAG: phosphoglucosamine mutase [Myxococcota bacterium]|nr:phosphoglucosamine mutase [Myxococcota bacterium]